MRESSFLERNRQIPDREQRLAGLKAEFARRFWEDEHFQELIKDLKKFGITHEQFGDIIREHDPHPESNLLNKE
jgi:uncharacterized protein (UPF0128 family)